MENYLERRKKGIIGCAAGKQLLFVIDDIHLADVETTDFLR